MDDQQGVTNGLLAGIRDRTLNHNNWAGFVGTAILLDVYVMWTRAQPEAGKGFTAPDAGMVVLTIFMLILIGVRSTGKKALGDSVPKA